MSDTRATPAVNDDDLDEDVVIVDDDEDFDDAVMILDDDTDDFDNDIALNDPESGEHITVIQTDPATGEDVSVSINMAMPPLGVEEAQELTERIKTSVNVVYVLLKRAHAGKAWSALGYTTFEEYVKKEFDISRSYAYKLLNQANVIEAIESVAPEGTQIYIGEGVARNIKRVLPEVLAEIETRTADIDDPDSAGAVIEDIIREQRERQAAAVEAGDDDEENPREYTGPYSEDYEYDNDDDEDGDEERSATDTVDDPADVRRKFEKLYALYSGLKNISNVGDGGELVDIIPENRQEEFTTLLDLVEPWIIDFHRQWREHLANLPTDENPDDGDLFIEDEDEDVI